MDRIGIGLLYIMLILTSLYATVGTLILLAGLADYYIREEKIQGKKILKAWLYSGIAILIGWILTGGFCVLIPPKINFN